MSPGYLLGLVSIIFKKRVTCSNLLLHYFLHATLFSRWFPGSPIIALRTSTSNFITVDGISLLKIY